MDPSKRSPMLRRLRARLAEYDDVFENLAEDFGGELDRDYHNQIARDIDLPGTDGITRSIQLTVILANPDVPADARNWKFDLTMTAWKDVADDRLVWSKDIRQFKRLPPKESLRKLIEDAARELKQVKRSDLVSADKSLFPTASGYQAVLPSG